MINAEEHKKLLEQITELERNSTNYFDVEKEFFLITSDNLADVQTRLYGYSIRRNGIYEEDNLTPEAVAGLDGRGCYVYVEVKDDKITIKQDLNGSWGIYLFRHGDYFALSNSFFRLLDHVKFKYPLTVNRDYCHHLLMNELCSHAYSETSVNEIKLVERNAILYINTAKQHLDTEFIDYKEHTVSLDSEEGIAILDKWLEFWSDVLRGVAQHTNFIQVDLSGGFDSRISFLVALHSGIDLNKTRINSLEGTNSSPYEEDYEIASKITDHYGFKLNQPLPANRFLNYSFSDIWNLDLYSRQTFHKSPNPLWGTQKSSNKMYFLNGYGGETIRRYWQGLPKKLIKNQSNKTKPYSPVLSDELFISMETILESAFCNIRNKYRIEDSDSTDIPQYLYQETRCRSHFGKITLIGYFKGNVSIAPILDPELRLLQLTNSESSDPNLLMALLFTRYEPALLEFPFDKNHAIAPKTIEYAKKINERFPLVKKDKTSMSSGGRFHLQPRDVQVEKILNSSRNNKMLSGKIPEICLKALFESGRIYGLFTTYFDNELYSFAASCCNSNRFGSFKYAYSVAGVAKVLEDVEISQRNRPLYRDMQRFLEQDFAIMHDDTQIINQFKLFFTSRLYIGLISKNITGNFQILSVSDERTEISKPKWLQKNGVYYLMQSYAGKLEIVAKSDTDGQFAVTLMGVAVRSPHDRSKFIPYWIDYTKLIINGEKIFDEIIPAWCQKPYRYNMDAKAGEEIKIEVEWLPHRSDTGT